MRLTVKNDIFIQRLFLIATFIAATHLPLNATQSPTIDFHSSMLLTPAYSPQEALKYAIWRSIINKYDEYMLHNPYSNKERGIPKITHRIWLGSKLPQKSLVFGKSWSAKNPDWVHILWTDNPANHEATHTITPSSFQEVIDYLAHLTNTQKNIVINVSKLSFHTRKQFDGRRNYGEKSDILRYEILFHCGGLYIDTDFECLKSFDIFNESCDFYAGVSYQSSSFEVFNGLIGSMPRHPVLERCINEISKQTPAQSDHGVFDILKRTGPYFFALMIEQYFTTNPRDKTVLFPVTYFYPWPNSHLTKNSPHEIRGWIKPESHAIHHWSMSWFNKK
jgi:mannosyltransferase OCH1-like enzyme